MGGLRRGKTNWRSSRACGRSSCYTGSSPACCVLRAEDAGHRTQDFAIAFTPMRNILLALLATAALAAEPIQVTKVVWHSGPPTLPRGAKIAVLEGDPAKEGLFTMRIKLPAGTTIAPHWHPRDERVTVL